MENEEELNLDLEIEEEKKNRPDQRVAKLLSDKEALTKERETEVEARKKAEAEKVEALKDVEFFKNFNTVASKYQGASEYQEKIREKVNSGYTLEDAARTVLLDEGKFTAPPVQTPEVRRESPAGGSSPTNIKSGEKPLNEMSLDDRRNMLIEAEKRGEIGLT